MQCNDLGRFSAGLLTCRTSSHATSGSGEPLLPLVDGSAMLLLLAAPAAAAGGGGAGAGGGLRIRVGTQRCARRGLHSALRCPANHRACATFDGTLGLLPTSCGGVEGDAGRQVVVDEGCNSSPVPGRAGTGALSMRYNV